MKFKIIRSDRAFRGLVKGLNAGVCSLLLEKTPLGDRLFVLTPTGASIGVIDWETRPRGCPYEAEVRAFMDKHGANDGLLAGLSQTYAIGANGAPVTPCNGGPERRGKDATNP